MARNIGGRRGKARILPGVGFPVPVNTPAAAAPSGGFASSLALWPFGLAQGSTAPSMVVNIFSGRGGGAAAPLAG